MDAGALAAAYVVIAATYTSELLSCEIRDLVKTSTPAKLALLLFGSLIVTLNSAPASARFADIAVGAAALFAAVMMSTRTRAVALVPILALAFADQVLGAYERGPPRGWERFLSVEAAGRWRGRARVAIGALLVLGVADYVRTRYAANPKRFSLWDALATPGACARPRVRARAAARA